MSGTAFLLRAVRTLFDIGFLCLFLSAGSLGAQEQEAERGAPLERDDAAEIRAQMATAEGLLGKTTDRGAVLYFLAASHALLGETLPALDRLKECLALREGFDPSGDISFAALKTSPDFQKLLEQVHRDFPAVNLSKIVLTSADKDIFPEGFAYDQTGESFFMSSIYYRKIVKLSRDGKISDFVPGDRYNLLPVLGIRFDPSDGSLWSNSASESKGSSELLHFNRSAELLARYPPADKERHVFNDLVVLRSGLLYLTDTSAGKVYRFDPKTRRFDPLTTARPLIAPNGIALTDDDETLYVADALGVLHVDLNRGLSVEVDPAANNTLAGIDGLYWHKGNLVAVQNGIGTPRVASFRLSQDGLRVAKAVVLQTPLKTPTTGALRGDDFYFIVNTQIDNLNGGRILDRTQLQPVRIAVVHLP